MSSTAVAAPAALRAAPPKENLYRGNYSDGAIGVREDSGAAPLLNGHFSVFDTWTEINSAYEGNFLERVAPTAFDKTIAEGRSQMRVLFQHGRDPSIGEKVLGPISRLETDSTGPYYEVPLLDTSYNRDLIPGLRDNLYGASFRFQVIREEFNRKVARSEHNPQALPERTILEARVREFGPVTFGAYPEATAGVRSLTDEFLFDELVADPDRLRALCKRAGISLAGVDTPFSARGITINISGDIPDPGETAAKVAERLSDTSETVEETEPEPDASERTTPTETEPEPSEATTHSEREFVFLFARKNHESKE